MSREQAFRRAAVAGLTDATGVYALCDLDGQPIYVGQSTDGIRSRVRRHLTSARSDVIANRQIDVWEVAYVRAWEVSDPRLITPMERRIFAHFDRILPLMNGAGLSDMFDPESPPDPDQTVQVIPEAERQLRLAPDRRLTRQIAQYDRLVDYILTVKNAPHLRKSLDAHFARLVRYHAKFLT